MNLHAYQETARDFLQVRGRAALFLEMGLGKTATTLSALTPDHLPALVLAPKRVAEEVWHEEAAKWRPDLRVVRAQGRPPARAAALADPRADVVVLGWNVITDLTPEHVRRWKTVIIDELSGFKSRGQRWKTARRAVTRPNVEYVWGLTGSPTPNGLLDLWSQAYLLDGGTALGTTVGGYRARYFVPVRQLPNGVVTEWEPRPGAQERIFERMESLALAMGNDGLVDLPPVTINIVKVPLPTPVMTTYRKMKRDRIAAVDILGDVTAPTAAHLSNRLLQISAGFVYPNADEDDPAAEYSVLHREKVQAVREIVEGTGSPVLVAYWYRAELDALRAAFPEARMVSEPGVVADWNAGRVPVLLAHPASAGHGLNLQYGGHTIVWTTLPWSMEYWTQFNARLARQGQTHPVMIHVLQAPRTLDADVLAALEGKISLQQALMDHLESPL